ncbi:GtrA family protein [Helicobacter sp. T3_23-1056]
MSFSNLFHSQFLRYFGSAFVAMCVNLASRIFYELFFGFGVSVALGYISGHFVNFAISQKYIFPKDKYKSTKIAFVRFSLVACVGLFVQTFIAIVALNAMQSANLGLEMRWQKLIAHICGIGFSFICNFLGHKFFSFRDTNLLKRRSKK